MPERSTFTALRLYFVVLDILSDGLYAVSVGSIGHWLKGNIRFLRSQRYFSDGIYITLGVATALSGSGKEP